MDEWWLQPWAWVKHSSLSVKGGRGTQTEKEKLTQTENIHFVWKWQREMAWLRKTLCIQARVYITVRLGLQGNCPNDKHSWTSRAQSIPPAPKWRRWRDFKPGTTRGKWSCGKATWEWRKLKPSALLWKLATLQQHSARKHAPWGRPSALVN